MQQRMINVGISPEPKHKSNQIKFRNGLGWPQTALQDNYAKKCAKEENMWEIHEIVNTFVDCYVNNDTIHQKMSFKSMKITRDIRHTITMGFDLIYSQ